MNSPNLARQRVLMLSASAGAGHVRAADALLAEFRQRSVDCAHWDILDYATPVMRYAYSKGYEHIVSKSSHFWRMLYESSDHPGKRSLARDWEMLNSQVLHSAIRQFNPTTILCTHFSAAAIASELFARGKVPCRPDVVVTDFDVHAYWFVPHYHRYFVAIEESRVYLERLGIDPARITVSGIPIDPAFRAPYDKAAARRALGLDPDLPTILQSAGAFGLGPAEKYLAELLTMKLRAQVVVIAGHNDHLKARIDRVARAAPADGPIKVHPIGYTFQMHDYMAAADLLISKTGGLTTSEALVRGLPLCVIKPIPGQEERIADHLLEAGAAIKCNNLPTLGWKIETLLRDPPRLAAMRARATALARPLAGPTIVQQALA
jgi:processive 1,2-diacylglycerol beta-glucosyltransferase